MPKGRMFIYSLQDEIPERKEYSYLLRTGDMATGDNSTLKYGSLSK